MIGLGLLAGAVLIGLPLAVIYLLVSNTTLKRSVADLEISVGKLQDNAKSVTEIAPVVRPEVSKPLATNASEDDEAEKAAPKAASAADVIAARRADARAIAEQSVAPVISTQETSTGPSLFIRLVEWLSDNWFYAVSAVSLALAGLFLVQYGMENGLLPPAARVASALGFGAALVGVGEYIRRRFGDAADSTTAYLPSVFAGAGIVSLFGGVLSAQMLYGLIGANTALIGLVVVAGVAVVLGWFYGPLLAAIGVIGAFGAPMVFGDSGSDPTPLFGYYALITAVGLGVDTLRRWAWVSGLTVILAYVMGTLLYGGDHALVAAYQLYLFAAVVMAVLIPARALVPDHSGSMITEWITLKHKAARPMFPVILGGAAMAASSALLLFVANMGEAEFWLTVIALAGLCAATIVWSLRAPALQDMAALPVVGLLLAVAAQSMGGDVLRAYGPSIENASEGAFPFAATALVGIALLLSALAAWRSLSKGDYPAIWAATAAVIAPLMAIVLEMGWHPSDVIGAYSWALHGAVLAAFMVFWAERFAKADGPENRLRVSFFVLAALASISFAFVVILSSAALTVALAVTVVAAAALDRRYDLHPMTIFITAGIVTLGYRLIADPGLDWAKDAPVFEVIFAYGGVLAAMIASLWLLEGKDRISARIMLDSAAWSVGGVLISVLVFRAVDAFAAVPDSNLSHWSMGIYAAIWFTLALAQVQRLEIAGHIWMMWVRRALGGVFGVMGLGALVLAVVLFSPLFSDEFLPVAGVPLFNTLAVAYLLPAVVLIVGWRRVAAIPKMLRIFMQGVSGALVVLWAFASVRHFWQGAEGMPLENGMTQPELYSYTIALLLIGGALFYQSMARRSTILRKAGLVVIGAAVAKVFFIDISGLEGLTRVFSLLVLGLSLAGLAWLNRWAQEAGTVEIVSPPKTEPE